MPSIYDTNLQQSIGVGGQLVTPGSSGVQIRSIYNSDLQKQLTSINVQPTQKTSILSKAGQAISKAFQAFKPVELVSPVPIPKKTTKLGSFIDWLDHTGNPANRSISEGVKQDLQGFRFFIPKPVYAPAEEGDTEMDIKKLVASRKIVEKYDSIYKLNKQASGGILSLIEGASGGIIKNTIPPDSFSESVLQGTSNVLGSIVILKALGNAFGSLAMKNATIANFVSKYPKVQKYVYPIAKNILAFDVYGQLDPEQKNRFAQLAKDTATGALFSATGFIGKARYSIPANFGLGFGLAKLQGATNEDAFLAGGILAGLDTAGRLQQFAFATRFRNGSAVYEPQEAIKQVMNSAVQETPLGKEILRAAMEAEQAGAQVRIDYLVKGRPRVEVAGEKILGRQVVKAGEASFAVSVTQGGVPEVKPAEISGAEVKKTAEAPVSIQKAEIEVPQEVASQIEKKSWEKLAADPGKMVGAYKEQFGNVVNADSAKEMFRDTGYKTDGSNSDEVAAPSSKLAQLVFNDELVTNKGSDGNQILFTMGGPGAGKSSTTLGVLDKKSDDFSIVNDQTGANYDHLTKSVKQSLDNGYDVRLAYVYRDPVDAFANGVLRRTRYVGVEETLIRHINSFENIKRVMEEYKDNPKITYTIIDNTKGKGNAVILDSKQALALFETINYNKEELERQIAYEIDKNQKISQAVKDKYLANKSGRNLKEIIEKSKRVSKTQPKDVVIFPKEKPIKLSQAEKEAMLGFVDMVTSGIDSGDLEGAKTFYKDMVGNIKGAPAFEKIVDQYNEMQAKEAEDIKAELAQKKYEVDTPEAKLVEIADKLAGYYKERGKIFQITGKGERVIEGKEKTLILGGDAKSAFDKLIYSTDMEGFAKNIQALADKYNETYTEISAMIKHGDIDGGDYEIFKKRFAENREKTVKQLRGRVTVQTQPQTGAVTKTGREVVKSVAKPKEKVSAQANLGFNPINKEALENKQITEETNKVIKRSEIAKRLSEKLGVPIRRGKFRSAGAIGIFKPKPKVVRIKGGGLPTIFHEVGHFLDDQFKLSKTISITERKALMKEYGYEYKNQPLKQRKEALAEFIRFKMTGQDTKAHELAPHFYDEWNRLMDKMPEVKAVLDEATQDYIRWMKQPASAKILSHISIGSQKKDSLINRATATLHNLYTTSLDDLHPLSEYSALARKKLGPVPSEKDPYILARLLRGWMGKADLFLTKGTFGKHFWSINEKGKAQMNFTGPGYSEIMKPVEKANALDDFRVYIVAKRALELHDRGITTGINPDDAREAIAEQEKKHPDFNKISEQRLAYKNALLDYLADPSTGVLGEESLGRIKQLNKYHVPFYRVMEELVGTGFMGRKKMAGNLSSPIKKIKGSEREIIDPLESDIKDTYAMINAAERNSIGIAMANLATQNFELGRLFEEVVRPMKPITVNVGEVLKKVSQEAGLNEDDIPTEYEDMIATIFRPMQDRGPNMLNVNMGDKQKVFQVDPELFKAIQGLNIEDAGMIMRILAIPSRILRAGATLTPDFSVRNPVRDQFSALVYSNYGFIPGFDLIRGIFEVFKKGDVYDLWKAGGGEHSMLVSMDRDYLQHTFKDLIQGKGNQLAYFTKYYIKHPIGLLQTLSELGEQATRLGEMKRAIEAKATPTTAAMSTREVTVDFARVGAKTKAVNLLIAFWNANVQGLDRMVRSFKKNPFRTLLKTILGITLPSILLYLANRDDERWKEIPTWQKNLFWIILTPKHIFRIPKPFELGILFGSVPERILEYIDTKNPELFNQMTQDIANGASPGFIPTALQPIIENIANYSFFFDRPIVPSGKENLPPEAQYGTYTSETAKLIGEALNYSPAKVDNLIQGYGAGLANYAVKIIDRILIGTGISTPAPKPAMDLESTPIIRSMMIREPIGTASESVNQIYKLYDEVGGELTYVRKLNKEGNREEATKYIQSHPEIVTVGIINGTVEAFSNINRSREQVMNSRKLTPEQKRDKIKQLDRLQTNLAEKALLKINNARKNR